MADSLPAAAVRQAYTTFRDKAIAMGGVLLEEWNRRNVPYVFGYLWMAGVECGCHTGGPQRRMHRDRPRDTSALCTVVYPVPGAEDCIIHSTLLHEELPVERRVWKTMREEGLVGTTTAVLTFPGESVDCDGNFRWPEVKSAHINDAVHTLVDIHTIVEDFCAAVKPLVRAVVSYGDANVGILTAGFFAELCIMCASFVTMMNAGHYDHMVAREEVAGFLVRLQAAAWEAALSVAMPFVAVKVVLARWSVFYAFSTVLDIAVGVVRKGDLVSDAGNKHREALIRACSPFLVEACPEGCRRFSWNIIMGLVCTGGPCAASCRAILAGFDHYTSTPVVRKTKHLQTLLLMAVSCLRHPIPSAKLELAQGALRAIASVNQTIPTSHGGSACGAALGGTYVGFCPTGRDTAIRVNLYTAWEAVQAQRVRGLSHYTNLVLPAKNVLETELEFMATWLLPRLHARGMTHEIPQFMDDVFEFMATTGNSAVVRALLAIPSPHHALARFVKDARAIDERWSPCRRAWYEAVLRQVSSLWRDPVRAERFAESERKRRAVRTAGVHYK